MAESFREACPRRSEERGGRGVRCLCEPVPRLLLRSSATRSIRSRGPFVSLDVLLSWATTKVGAVEVEHSERAVGASTYSFGKLVSLALTMLTGFSTRPLRIASLVGLATTVFGVLILVYVVVRFVVEGNPVPGFPFLASMIAIFSGAQLFALGIIGEYIGRMHVRTMSQPAYVVRREVGQGGTEPT